MAPRYVVGIDFGTESARAVVVDVADGYQLSSALYPYSNGVIDERLPESGVELAPGWALQDPDDYLRAMRTAVPAALSAAAVNPVDVIGIGIDFTACTMLPTLLDGTPLCHLPAFRANPHAWVKLWKHHAAQPEADEVNRIARERGEAFLWRYGDKISSEWLFPKILQILREAPEVYAAAGRLIEAADWVIWQLTGSEVRTACAAGYKAIWDTSTGYPSSDYLSALDPRLVNVVDEKLSQDLRSLGTRAGGLTPQAAAWTGLLPGTAVAVANLDAHASVPACGVREPARMVMIMGTSICHLVLGTEVRNVEGMCGVVEDGVIPGFWGFEAGQSCVGDGFAWFVENCVPGAYENEALRRGLTIHELLEQKAAGLRPGESGLLALDWLNGNRSILVDVDLTGLLVGLTIATRPEEIYRALIESTAFGTRTIIETFIRSGVPITELIACGGLPERNRLLMQIYADVTGLPISVAASSQTPALGAAMHAAVAAGEEQGGYSSILEAADRMGHLRADSYQPNMRAKPVYDRLYAEYKSLHDYFGRGTNDVMKRLGALRFETKASVGSAESRNVAEGEEIEAAARQD